MDQRKKQTIADDFTAKTKVGDVVVDEDGREWEVVLLSRPEYLNDGVDVIWPEYGGGRDGGREFKPK